MLTRFFKKNKKQINYACVQLANRFSTKKSGSNEFTPGQSIDLPREDAIKKVWRCMKRDGAELKQSLTFWKEFKNPALDNIGRVMDWDDPNAPIFPNHCDVVIIGGGGIGSSIAYWCKTVANQSMRVVVIEKDPTYQQASTVLSVGGLRQQFSLEENIEMSLFGAEFLSNINQYLGIEGEPPVDVQFHPYGYLSLSTAETAEILINNSKLQNSKGAKNEILNQTQLRSKFPWLNVNDLEVGCLGLEKEGWFDPWSLLGAFKKKAISLGAEFITAEAVGFNFKLNKKIIFSGEEPGKYEGLEYLVVRTADGKLRPIHFSKCIIAAGAFSANVAKMARVGIGKNNLLSLPLPVEPRKRYVYCVHAPEGPGLNTPMTIDPTGTYFRREGLDNHYICGRCPPENEEPSVDNLDVDHQYFEEKIWPVLANRVKGFENLKVKSSWAGFYEYNTFDENGIIGFHPYHDNLIFATGFSGHGIQQAPAVGRAISELIYHGDFRKIDLSRLSFDRFITKEQMMETNIW